MTVDKSRAVTAEHDGHTYWFCSEHCRHEFHGV
jgi:YHS domain-containing protein